MHDKLQSHYYHTVQKLQHPLSEPHSSSLIITGMGDRSQTYRLCV